MKRILKLNMEINAKRKQTMKLSEVYVALRMLAVEHEAKSFDKLKTE